jgi:GTPase SAR1 family protein
MDPNTKNLDRFLKTGQSNWAKEAKLLLLGPGESGKSTVFKQLKIIQDNGGFSKEELVSYIPVVRSNAVSQMRVVLEAAALLKIELFSEEALMAAKKILSLPTTSTVWNNEIAQAVTTLWHDKGIKETYALGNKKYQLNETAEYFFEGIERFSQDNYVPSVDDVLRVRVRSTGIEEAVFRFDNMSFRVVDVGGQRSERRKWIHCFDCVTCVIFCASLNGYDQVLREDRTQNRLHEAILLFDEVANSNCFQKNDIILFLNKEDLYLEKIKIVPLDVCFQGYQGGDDPETGKIYIRDRFLERTKSSVFVHFTCAINTKNIDFVIRSVMKSILTNTLGQIFLENKSGETGV